MIQNLIFEIFKYALGLYFQTLEIIVLLKEFPVNKQTSVF